MDCPKGKKYYSTKKKAKRAKKILSRLLNKKYGRPYHCEHCLGWHLTTHYYIQSEDGTYFEKVKA